jgi:hypothetical protein
MMIPFKLDAFFDGENFINFEFNEFDSFSAIEEEDEDHFLSEEIENSLEEMDGRENTEEDVDRCDSPAFYIGTPPTTPMEQVVSPSKITLVIFTNECDQSLIRPQPIYQQNIVLTLNCAPHQ